MKNLAQGHTASSEPETEPVSMHFTLHHAAKAGDTWVPTPYGWTTGEIQIVEGLSCYNQHLLIYCIGQAL